MKKFSSLHDELKNLETQLKNIPESGIPLGNNTYKIRLSIKSKGKGKSGGARVITYLESELIGFIDQQANRQKVVNLISIYDKSETASISPKEIKELIRYIHS